MGDDTLSVLVVMDYQNIHLTGHERFVPNGHAKHESLVQPLHFANQALITRTHRLAVRAMSRGEQPPAPTRLDRVEVFRGSPSNKQSPTAYRRSQAQRSEWTRDPRVEVQYRTLRYLWDGAQGRHVPSEKGIDVLAALAVVRAADSGAFDLIILASHDTDLEPALEAAIAGPRSVAPVLKGMEHTSQEVEADAESEPRALIETVGWDGCKRLRAGGYQIRHTSMGAGEFVRSRDRKDYT